MRTTVSLPELVRAAKAGEEAAWNALYQQYYPKLYAVALRLYSNGPAAKDAVQETFIIAYLKLFQLQEIATFGGWLKKILLHHSYRDLHRNRLNVRLDTLVLASDAWWEDELSNQM